MGGAYQAGSRWGLRFTWCQAGDLCHVRDAKYFLLVVGPQGSDLEEAAFLLLAQYRSSSVYPVPLHIYVYIQGD